MKSVLVFDLDHTVADSRWRLNKCPTDPNAAGEAWDAYHAGMMEDKPVREMAMLIDSFDRDGAWRLIAVTSRPVKWKPMTTAWLARHNIPIPLVLMPEGDHPQPPVMKLGLVAEHLGADWEFQVAAVFDDDARVCKAFAERGILTFQPRLPQ